MRDADLKSWFGTCVHRTRLQCAIFCLLLSLGSHSVLAAQRDDEIAWTKLLDLADELFSEKPLSAQDSITKADAIVDLHAKFMGEVLGRPVSSQRILATKQAMRLFLRSAQERFSGNKRQSMLRLLRDLATNRALFIELLSSNVPVEVAEQRLLAFAERNSAIPYAKPIPTTNQVSILPAQTPLQIFLDGIRLVKDEGVQGHYNGAIDAGETITINIPLKNTGNTPFRSTSAILETDSLLVKTDKAKVIYTERSQVGGDTTTFAPGTTIAPKQNFVFTILPRCQDGEVIAFKLHVGDSDQGEFFIPFNVKVYNVGPLDFGEVRIDDDRFGDSDGNGNGVIELGETIEYVLALRNRGMVSLENIDCTLFTSEKRLKFKQGYDTLKFKSVAPRSERSIPASFVFSINGSDEGSPDFVAFQLFAQGVARGHRYTWLRSQTHSLRLLPTLNAELSDVRLFEGGKATLPESDRIYSKRFSRSECRFIYLEMHLRSLGMGKEGKAAFDLIWYYPDGEVMSRDSNREWDLRDGWNRTWIAYGQGFERPGNWRFGDHKVQVFFESKLVATAAFTIE